MSKISTIRPTFRKQQLERKNIFSKFLGNKRFVMSQSLLNFFYGFSSKNNLVVTGALHEVLILALFHTHALGAPFLYLLKCVQL